jgi:hypothetical protein
MVDSMTITVFGEDMTAQDRAKWGMGVGDVLLNVTAFMRGEGTGVLSVNVAGVTSSSSSPIQLPSLSYSTNGDLLYPISLLTVISASSFQLWYPNGYGPHPLYNLTTTFTSSSTSTSLSCRIAFRRIFVRRLPIPDQPGLTFYFEVNGLPIFNKGSNLVPSTPFHVNETEMMRRTLIGAVESHQSIIRVWGGGSYESDFLYDYCDENGIMLWQEFVFANSFYPVFTDFLDNVREEVSQQVRRLTGHGSLSVWCGNNEIEGDILTNGGKDSVNHDHALIDYNNLFTNTIRDAIIREIGTYSDGTPHTDYLMSSPANGPASLIPFTWVWGASRDLSQGDLHYYNYDVDCSVPANFPQPRHLTEWGWQSYPSFITWLPVTNGSDWQLDSALMQNRQHHPDGNAQQLAQIQRHFHVPNATDPRQQFDDYTYISQSVAALCYGTLMSFYRTLRDQAPSYTMGSMYWQLSDQWQAPTWSSMEVRGRWKQNHYAVKRAFAPLLITGHINNTKQGDILTTYIVSDLQTPVVAQWQVELRSWVDGSLIGISVEGAMNVSGMYSKLVLTQSVDELLMGKCNRTNCFIRMSANIIIPDCQQKITANPISLENFLLLTSLTNVTLFDPNIKFIPQFYYKHYSSLPSASYDQCQVLHSSVRPGGVRWSEGDDVGQVEAVTLTVSGSAVGVYVWLESRVEGYWSDNSFVLLPGNEQSRTVTFIGYESFDADSFIQTLQVRSIRDTYTRDQREQSDVQPE